MLDKHLPLSYTFISLNFILRQSLAKLPGLPSKLRSSTLLVAGIKEVYFHAQIFHSIWEMDFIDPWPQILKLQMNK